MLKFKKEPEEKKPEEEEQKVHKLRGVKWSYKERKYVEIEKPRIPQITPRFGKFSLTWESKQNLSKTENTLFLIYVLANYNKISFK